MIRKGTAYTAAQLGWALLVGATFVVLYSGQAEPVVPAADLPRPLWIPGAVAVALIAAGWIFILYSQARSWRAMGRRVGLAADEPSTGLLGPLAKPDLTGTVSGRPVRVHTVERSGVATSDGDGHSSSGDVTTTVVEAELDEPADVGVVIGRIGSGDVGPDETDLGTVRIPNETVDDRLVATAGSAALARDLVTPRVRESLLEADTLETLLVGNAVDTAKDAVETMAEERSWGRLDVGAFDEVLYDDPATVANQFQRTLLDADELDRQLDAVVAVADSFEEVLAETATERVVADE